MLGSIDSIDCDKCEDGLFLHIMRVFIFEMQ